MSVLKYWDSGTSSWQVAIVGAEGATGPSGSFSGGNIIPALDNTYFLGNSTNRWANLWLGPGTLYITDSNIASNVTAALTVTDGVLLINGVNQQQVGQLKFVDNTIESTTGNIPIQIGLTTSSANLLLNRNTVLAPGKTLGLVDTANTANVATLSVTNGVLNIGNVVQLQAPGITNGNANIAIANSGNVTITTLPGSTPLQWIFDDTGNLRCASVTEQDNLIGENNGDFLITGSQSVKLNAGLSGNVSLTVNESNITVTGDIFTTGNLTVSTNPNLPDAIDVNGAIYDSSFIVSDIGNDHVAQTLLTRFSTEVWPIVAGAMNNSDDPLVNGDVGYGQALFQIGSLGYAGNNYKEFGGIIFSAEDNNSLYTISDTSAPGKIDFNTTPNGEVSTSTGMTLHCDQTLRFSNGLILNSGNVPVTSKGQTGDLAGMFIIDNSYIYYCTADYTDGTADIWNRTEQTTGTW